MQHNGSGSGSRNSGDSVKTDCQVLALERPESAAGLPAPAQEVSEPDCEVVAARPEPVNVEFAPPHCTGFRMSDRLIPGLVGALDVFAMLFSSTLWFLLYVGPGYALANYYFAATISMTVVSASLLNRAGLYNFETIAAWPNRIGRMLFAVSLAAMILTGLAFLLKISDHFSRIWSIGTFLTAVTLIVMFRIGMAAMIDRLAVAGRLRRNVAVFGVGPQTRELIDRLDQHNAPWINLAGLFDDRASRLVVSPDDPPVLGDFEDLIANIRAGRIDCVVITLPWYASDRLLSIFRRLQELPVDVYLGADMIGYHYPMHQRQFASGISVMEVADLPLSGWRGVLKALVDKVIAAVAVVLLSPILLAIAFAIKLESRGSVLFRQERYGFNNEVINVYKFRTMYQHRPAEAGVPQATRNDPRVTRVGRFLRRTSLDELPQLINVLQGNMAIVGPRPHAVEHNLQYSQLIPGYYSRHRVKPGITGWAQVKGYRGETSTVDQMQARIDCDCYYIENWSPWFDLKIMALTMWTVMRGSNAY